jgi:hypothetical protein
MSSGSAGRALAAVLLAHEGTRHRDPTWDMASIQQSRCVQRLKTASGVFVTLSKTSC